MFKIPPSLAAASTVAIHMFFSQAAEAECNRGQERVGVVRDCNARHGNKEPERSECRQKEARKLDDIRQEHPEAQVIATGEICAPVSKRGPVLIVR